MKFTLTEKIRELRREVDLRRLVYARLVDNGKMTQKQAAIQIHILEEIIDDYNELAAKERLL